ncbi:MAG: NAD(P)-dependent oxidoreductase [Lachnospiraceae bacterium]|nr:NAD(P)-dependent oxidoreductase [Lachnospiraceae bacterium]
MSTILITGKTEFFTEEILRHLAEEHKLVLAGGTDCPGGRQNLRVYPTSPAEENFGRLFDVYSVDAVWYVSGFTDGGEGIFGENRYIEKVMEECRRSRVEKVVFLSTVESLNYLKRYGKSGLMVDKEYQHSRAFGAAQAEESCLYFAEKYHLKVVMLRLPYVAGRLNQGNFLGHIFWNLYRGERVTLPYRPDDRIDFLSLDEISELLVQITEETEDESGVYTAVSGYRYTYADFDRMVKTVSPKVQIVYEKLPNVAEFPEYPKELRRVYGFVPTENVMENIGLCYRTFLRESIRGKRRVRSAFLGRLLQAGGSLYPYMELLAVFLLTELTARFTSNSVYFKFVDVRLLFIVIMGTMYGMRAGWVAAGLECIVLVRQYALLGVGGTLLFYNIENWIPFVAYLMAGSVTGYIRNKKADEIAFAKKEYSLLRDKYLFLNDVYHGAVENKGEYKKQILGFKDSFGKIFDAVQKLDAELSESIFLEGLGVLENILENHSVAIYTLDSWQRFGRLAVCSSSRLSSLTKSIRMEDYGELYAVTSQCEVWKNTELKEQMPMYACGVFKKDEMVLLVVLWEAEAKQYGMHYMNLFKILCGLVQTSFLRALEYERAAEREMYYEQTNIVYPKRFQKVLAVWEDMRAAGIADYMLLRFREKEKKTLNSRLSGVIRASDVLGADENGTLYLLLIQTNQTNYRYIEERLHAYGLEFEWVDKVG